MTRDEAIALINQHPYRIDDETGCRLATIGMQKNGYVQVRRGEVREYLHRLVAFVYYGLPLDSKFLALHSVKCPNKHCFNHLHIYVGNESDNASDYVSQGKHHEASKLTCDKGHKLDKIMNTTRDGIVRYCSICRRDAQKRFRRRHTA